MKVGYVIEADSAPRLDKTWKEIHDHIALGSIVIIISSEEISGGYVDVISLINAVESYIDQNENHIYGVYTDGEHFITDNENGYPVFAK